MSTGAKREIYILATIEIICSVEYYSDILGLFENIEQAERLRDIIINKKMSSDEILQKYKIDIECLREYTGFVIFSLPLYKNSEKR